MTIQEARKYSQGLVLKGTSIIFGILIFIFLLGETRGDFANGILFFLSGLFAPSTIIGFFLLFFISAYFGRQAGEEIIIKRKSIFMVATKYSILISLTITVYVMLVAVLNRGLNRRDEISILITSSFLTIFIQTLLFVFLVWIWATKRMKNQA